MQFITSQLLEKLTIKTDEKVRLHWHLMLLTGDGMMPPIDLFKHELEAEATDLFQRLIEPGGRPFMLARLSISKSCLPRGPWCPPIKSLLLSQMNRVILC